MRHTCTFILFLTAMSLVAQPVRSSFASIAASNKMDVVKSSISIPSWHEKSFWPVYDKYAVKVEESANASYTTLTAVTRMEKEVSAEEADQRMRSLFEYRKKAFDVRKAYYIDIASEFNGNIALQFIQTEALLDMMQSAEVYESSAWKQYQFRPNAIDDEKVREAKHNTMKKAISIPDDKASAFWVTYAKYEEESNALLGDEYSLVALFAGDASDYTPGLAKRLGYDLLQLLERDIKIKNKYYEKMREAVGAPLAARFIAWEDYYSLLSKMNSWAEQ
jgi:hypothetical protein